MLPALAAPSQADDAFFFIRYAEQFRKVGSFVWNQGEPPTFGSTSQLYQLVVALAHELTGRHAVRTLALTAQIPTLATMLVVAAAAWGITSPRLGAPLRSLPAALVVAFATMAAALSAKFVNMAWTGMETAIAALATAVYVALIESRSRSGRPLVPTLVVGGWILILARPELGLLATLTPLALVIWGEPRQRRQGLVALVLLGCLIVATVATAWAYYGSPVPLPFFVKTLALSPYDVNAKLRFQLGNMGEIYRLLREHGALVFVIFCGWLWGYRLPPHWRGLVLGTVAFFAYHAIINALPITPGGGRFFLPLYPVIVLLATRWLAEMLADPALPSRARYALAGAALLTQLVLLGPPFAKATAARLSSVGEALSLPQDHRSTLLLNWRRLQLEKWFALDRMATLPAGCSVATSEVGVIGVLYPEMRLIDLSGLNDKRVALEGFDTDWLLTEVAADIVYPQLIEFYWGVDLLDDPRFIDQYRVFPSEALGNSLAIATRRSSACGAGFADLIDQALAAPK